jgi:hypothetical protein
MIDNHDTPTPGRWTSRLTPEQRADIKDRVATWPPLTEMPGYCSKIA